MSILNRQLVRFVFAPRPLHVSFVGGNETFCGLPLREPYDPLGWKETRKGDYICDKCKTVLENVRV